MTHPPIQLYGPRGEKLKSGSNPLRFGGGNDTMIEQGRQTWDRKRIPMLDQDLHRNMSTYGRRTLMSLGRSIYFSNSAVRGAVEDQCTYAAGCYMFESRSEDENFRESAEKLIDRNNRICDVAGPPYNDRTFRKGIARAINLDGDQGVIWVRGEDGEPYLQVIPAHRIASLQDVVEGGPFDGARIIDGVIVNDQNRALAYRVVVGDAMTDYVDVPATSMRLIFIPIFPGQLRGIPVLGLAAWDMQDLNESKKFELLAQKGAAARVFQEFNEEGEAPVGSDYITGPSSTDTTTGTPTGLWRETIDGGLNTYFKSNSGSRLEAIKFDRPSRNQQDFVAQVWREAMAGARLSTDFNLDLSKLSGGGLRLLVEKVNRNNEDLQLDAIEPVSRAWDFFRLGTWIESGQLQPVEDWMDWEYQAAAKLTPDAKYDAMVTAENIRIGLTTRGHGAAKGGEALRDVRKIRKQELVELLTMADEIHNQFPDHPLPVITARLENDQNFTEQYIDPQEPAAGAPAQPPASNQ